MSLESGVGSDPSYRWLSTYSTLLQLKTACLSLSVRQFGVLLGNMPSLVFIFQTRRFGDWFRFGFQV